ncbi:MAG: hypothetical protein QHC65_13320 [Sphingomonas sp.]|nr:hypothetical protein [Sphingomonas sp.]MDX3885399.1 hypothetical protein [Sphingomonas sp.]
MTYDNSPFGSNGWRLSFKSQLANAWHQRVELTTEEKFVDLDGTVAFQDADTTEAYHGHQKGSLTYWKGHDDIIQGTPPSYLVNIRLPGADLARLTQTVVDGMPLQSVNIEVPIEYGWEPDGSGKKWDNTANPAVEIESYHLFFDQPEEEEIVPDPPEETIDPHAKILTEVRAIARTSRHVLYAFIAAVVALLWLK